MSLGCNCGRGFGSETTPQPQPETPLSWKHAVAIAGGISVVALLLGWMVSGEAFGADFGTDLTDLR